MVCFCNAISLFQDFPQMHNSYPSVVVSALLKAKNLAVFSLKSDEIVGI